MTPPKPAPAVAQIGFCLRCRRETQPQAILNQAELVVTVLRPGVVQLAWLAANATAFGGFTPEQARGVAADITKAAAEAEEALKTGVDPRQTTIDDAIRRTP